MKKILIFYSGYIPGKRYGGPVTSIYHFTEMFGGMFELRVVCKNHDFLTKEKYSGIKSGWNKVGKAKVLYLSDREFRGKNFKKIINKVNPDLIYTSSIFSATMNIPLLWISKKNNIPVLLAPRGELSSDRLQSKKWKKTPYLFLLKKSCLLNHIMFQATSDAERADIMRVLSIKGDNLFVVPNIPCSFQQKDEIRKEKGIIKIITASRIQHKNNQLYSIKLVNRMKSKVFFDIYGPKEDMEYWSECEREISKAPENVTYTYRGNLPLTEIEKVYLNYDCLLHPTFSENYGHVIVEAFCHDCPIVISRGTTPWDSIQDVGGGYTCSLNSDEAFIEALEHIAQMDTKEYRILVDGTRTYSKQLNMEEIRTEYLNMISETIEQTGK